MCQDYCPTCGHPLPEQTMTEWPTKPEPGIWAWMRDGQELMTGEFTLPIDPLGWIGFVTGTKSHSKVFLRDSFLFGDTFVRMKFLMDW